MLVSVHGDDPVFVNGSPFLPPRVLADGDELSYARSKIEYRDPHKLASAATEELQVPELEGDANDASGADATVLITRAGVAAALAPDDQTVLAGPLSDPDRTVMGPSGRDAERTIFAPPTDRQDRTAFLPPRPAPATAAEPPRPPARPATGPAPSTGTVLKIVVAAIAFVCLVVIALSVAVLVKKPWQPAPVPTPAPPAPAETPSPTAPTPQGISIIRIDPPSAIPGAAVVVEAEGAPDDARVFFGPTAARLIERRGVELEVEVPRIASSTAIPVTVRAGTLLSDPRNFVVETPPLPVLLFHQEVAPASFQGHDTATVYLGPIPLFVLATPGQRTDIEERAKLATFDLEAARTALSSNPAATLAVARQRQSWQVVVSIPDARPLATVATIGKDELEYVNAMGSAVTAERLASHWMSVFHDAVAIAFGVGKVELTPEDSPVGAILRKLAHGGIETAFPTLTPEERALLARAAIEVPASLSAFEGSYRGVTSVDREAFPEITWPRAELKIDLSMERPPGLVASGVFDITWITAIDASGASMTSNKLGRFPFTDGRVDPTNPNHVTVTITHAGGDVTFELWRRVDPKSRGIVMEGRYGGTTDFVLKPL